ncbi:MAG: hypothetical protein KAW12_10665 [Candidatus Aminicenantes bacterium]|nr:hypothetical protein [Candidatus Aminicenantes bacterium]
MKKKKLSKNQFCVVCRRFVLWAVVLVLMTGLSLAAPAAEKDPLEVIKKKGTAGMTLQGGKTIVVRNNKLYVQSGKKLSALFPAAPRFTVKSNTSKLSSSTMQGLTLKAVKSKLGKLYNQSYKIHSSFKLKGQKGNEKTVLCKLVFQYKNIWYAEEKQLELVISSEGGRNNLKRSRVLMPRAVISRTALKKTTLQRKTTVKKTTMVRPAAAVDHGAAKRKKLTLNTATTAKLSKEYSSFSALPIYRLAREYRIPVYALGPTAKGLANTAYPEVVTAKDATNQVYFLMKLALGSAAKLIGPTQSSKTKVLNYLRNDANLVAWNNIGHGGHSTLYQGGTQINSTDIPASPLFKGLNGCVCLINSCQTFHDPLKAAILHHRPRVYIAGVLNLPMVTSEGSNPQFWYKTLFKHLPMSVAYSQTNTASGLTGYWGYWGYGGTF